jgi:hypothetical protein
LQPVHHCAPRAGPTGVRRLLPPDVSQARSKASTRRSNRRYSITSTTSRGHRTLVPIFRSSNRYRLRMGCFPIEVDNLFKMCVVEPSGDVFCGCCFLAWHKVKDGIRGFSRMEYSVSGWPNGIATDWTSGCTVERPTALTVYWRLASPQLCELGHAFQQVRSKARRGRSRRGLAFARHSSLPSPPPSLCLCASVVNVFGLARLF